MVTETKDVISQFIHYNRKLLQRQDRQNMSFESEHESDLGRQSEASVPPERPLFDFRDVLYYAMLY